jgi:hypothetical protein
MDYCRKCDRAMEKKQDNGWLCGALDGFFFIHLPIQRLPSGVRELAEFANIEATLPVADRVILPGKLRVK